MTQMRVGKKMLFHWRLRLIYLENATMTPDNNLAENAIRPFVIGRNYAQIVIMLS